MFTMVSSVFQVFLQVFSDAFFVCFQTYVAIIAYGCLKTRSSVASLFSSFCCLASVSGVGRRRLSPLVRAGTTGETWAGRRRTRDRRRAL